MRGNHIDADGISSNYIAGESYQLLTFVRILNIENLNIVLSRILSINLILKMPIHVSLYQNQINN